MIIGLAVLLFSIIAHELAHGYTAYYLGDKTAYMRGRLTWNPIAHIDPVGSVILPLFLWVSGSHFLFGWAKPVPVNPNDLPDPRKDMMLVSAAGPITNIIIAVVASRILWLFPGSKIGLPGEILASLVVLNIILPVFNLIPIPPLDGSRVLAGLLPYRYARVLDRMEPYGIAIVFLMMYLGVFNVVINWTIPVIEMLLK